jgi:hypothetical protein
MRKMMFAMKLVYNKVVDNLLAIFIFMYLHLASHLGTLDEPREGRDVGARPEDGVWWAYPEGGRTK